MAERRKGRRSCWRLAVVLLKKAHVEHVVDASLGWQVEADRDVVDELHHPVWAVELGL